MRIIHNVTFGLGSTGLVLVALANPLLGLPAGDSLGPQELQAEERPRLSVKPVQDFDVTGTGEQAAWRQTEWAALTRRQPDGHQYDDGKRTQWEWARVDSNFHDYQRFGDVLFADR